MTARKLTQEHVEGARAALAADRSLSIRQLAAGLGVNESTLRRRLRRTDTDGLSRNVEASFIEVPVITRRYHHLDELYVYPIGDVHLGSPAHQGARFDEWVSYLTETEDASMLGLGDMVNAAIANSKSDGYAELMTPQAAKWTLEDKLGPLADAGRLDALTEGNHENRIYRAAGIDLMADLARSLGVPYFSAAAFIVYEVGDVQYKVYVRHGTGNGQSLIQLEKSAMVAEADVYITGHVHKIATTADEYFVVRNGRTERRRRYYVSSGAFLAYERYAAERGYKPTRMGAPRIHLNGREHDVHVSI